MFIFELVDKPSKRKGQKRRSRTTNSTLPSRYTRPTSQRYVVPNVRFTHSRPDPSPVPTYFRRPGRSTPSEDPARSHQRGLPRVTSDQSDQPQRYVYDLWNPSVPMMDHGTHPNLPPFVYTEWNPPSRPSTAQQHRRAQSAAPPLPLGRGLDSSPSERRYNLELRQPTGLSQDVQSHFSAAVNDAVRYPTTSRAYDCCSKSVSDFECYMSCVMSKTKHHHQLSGLYDIEQLEAVLSLGYCRTVDGLTLRDEDEGEVPCGLGREIQLADANGTYLLPLEQERNCYLWIDTQFRKQQPGTYRAWRRLDTDLRKTGQRELRQLLHTATTIVALTPWADLVSVATRGIDETGDTIGPLTVRWRAVETVLSCITNELKPDSECSFDQRESGYEKLFDQWERDR